MGLNERDYMKYRIDYSSKFNNQNSKNDISDIKNNRQFSFKDFLILLSIVLIPYLIIKIS